jgi:glycosyltransferase involved in cell wall biosynthesis
MRISLDATYSVDPHPSGVAVYSREILDGLARLHAEHEYLHCYRIKQFRKTTGPRFANVHNRLLLPPLPTFRADLFHALNQRVDRRPARSVVSTFHDLFVITSEYSSADFRARFSEQARRAAANSDVIITVSEFTARQVESLLGVPRSRIRVIPHGVRPVTRSIQIERQRKILFVGAVQLRKNIVRLIEAFEQLPADWALILVGATTGFGSDKILERIRSSSAVSRIEVKGYVSDVDLDELYAAASIFAFPSLDEGFGIPVLDAMARGVPVLTSSTSALPEVAGSAAILVNPYDSREIAGGLLRLVEDPHLRELLTTAGYERAKLFTWTSAVEKTYAVYRDLLE